MGGGRRLGLWGRVVIDLSLGLIRGCLNDDHMFIWTEGWVVEKERVGCCGIGRFNKRLGLLVE